MSVYPTGEGNHQAPSTPSHNHTHGSLPKLAVSWILSVFAWAPWLGFLVLEAGMPPGVGSEASRDPEAL